MKIVGSAALLTGLVTPAYSLSYLENLNRANPVISAPSGGGVANGASYLDALALSASSAPSGGGMTSYLDSLPKNAVPSTAGAGMASYTDSLNVGVGWVPPANSPPAPAAATPAPATSVQSSVPSTPVATGNYMDSLSAAGSAGAPQGSGMPSYLDTLPRGTAPSGGAGIPTYKDGLPVTNTVAGSGAGMSTYTDNLSGGKGSSSSKGFSPFGSSPKPPSFVGSVGGSQIGFTLEADDITSLVEQLRRSGGTIKLSGSIDSISIN
jgi:hypothetical protein